MDIIVKIKRIMPKILFVLLLTVLLSLSAKAQEIIPESVDSLKLKQENLNEKSIEYKKIDTTCFRYRFIPRDTLIYQVISHDSISIDYGTPLRKDRTEILQVVCDSVSKKNRFFLSIKLLDLLSKEYEIGSYDTVRHNNSDWINRTVFVEIDSLGNRYSINYDDTNKVALAPGGGFQPHLFFSFESSCHGVTKSWRHSSTDYLVENGLPCAVLRYDALYTNLGEIDTLETKVNRLDFIRSGQGSITYFNPGGEIRLTNIVASSGILDIGKEIEVPFHLHQTMEQKISLHLSKDLIRPGRHYIDAYFTLVDYIKYNPKTKKNIKRNNQKKKK